MTVYERRQRAQEIMRQQPIMTKITKQYRQQYNLVLTFFFFFFRYKWTRTFIVKLFIENVCISNEEEGKEVIRCMALWTVSYLRILTFLVFKLDLL